MADKSARTGVKQPIEVLTSPFTRFARLEASGGILLLACTVAALIWANSPWHDLYEHLLEAKVTIALGRIEVTETRHHWINDGLMAVFFFLVGLEIKREILIGELSSLKQAAFPFLAAVGGAMLPAAIYFLFGRTVGATHGWGIPMATDIAFALGVLALLGSRVPASLKVFVAALAIVDDILCVLVISLFYTSEVSLVNLGVAAAGLAVSCLANWAGVRAPAVYAVISGFVWLAVLSSGVHATIAGVLMAFTIPARTLIDGPEFVARSRGLLNRFELVGADSREGHDAVHDLERQCEQVQSPLHRIEHMLHPWVSFFIMPVFALANAGVIIPPSLAEALTHPVTLGVAVGLFIGKPLGITTVAWLAAKLRIAAAPAGVTWLQIFGASWLCGIGFTMSLFVAGLAFEEPSYLDMSKIAILGASLLAGSAGAIVLTRVTTTTTA